MMNDLGRVRGDWELRKLIGDLEEIKSKIKRMVLPETGGMWLPFAQRALNPIAVNTIQGDFHAPSSVTQLRKLSVSVFVNAPNSGASHWTFDLVDTNGTTLFSVNTSSGVTAGVWTKLKDEALNGTPNQGVVYSIVITKTGTPGSCYLVPGLYAL